LSGKEKPNGTSSAPFCEGKHNSKSNERSQETKKKDKRVDVSGKLKRSKTVNNISLQYGYSHHLMSFVFVIANI
jgi:hypothetical protein